MRSDGNKNSLVRFLVVYLSLLIHVIVGVGSASGVVLCLKRNGSISWKTSMGDTCCSPFRSKGGEKAHNAARHSCGNTGNMGSSDSFGSSSLLSMAKIAHFNSECKMCVDVFMSAKESEESFQAIRRLSLQPVIIPTFSLFPEIILQHDTNKVFYYQALSPPVLTMLRTVVLRN